MALAEAYQREHIGTAVPVSVLSSIVGLSERALRDAFHSVRRMGPKRCLVAERLQGVRLALTDASIKPATITAVATEFGFCELGRFAGLYKREFGESPSDTLRRHPLYAAAHLHEASPCLQESVTGG